VLTGVVGGDQVEALAGVEVKPVDEFLHDGGEHLDDA